MDSMRDGSRLMGDMEPLLEIKRLLNQFFRYSKVQKCTEFGLWNKILVTFDQCSLRRKRVLSGRGTFGVEKVEKERRPISRKKIASAGVTALILMGVLFLYYNGFPTKSFHWELMVSQDNAPTDAWVILSELHDCILNVSFVDDPDLIYSMDVELSESAYASAAFEHTVSYDWGADHPRIIFQGAIIQEAMTRVLVDEVKLVLGSAVPYSIGVSGENVTSTFNFGNNMIGSDSYVYYRSSGPYLTMVLTEDMVFSVTGMEVSISGAHVPDNVYIDVDLVDGVNGVVRFDGSLYLHENIGWTEETDYSSYTTYSTDPSKPEPLLAVFMQNVDWVHLWLRN